MSEVLVTGASGRVGRRVVSRLRTSGHAVTGLDIAKAPDVVEVDLSVDDLDPHVSAGATIVHLSSSFDGVRGAEESGRLDLVATNRLLAAATKAKSKKFVLMSSAMVYGAWPANPIPLTEAAPLRPNPEFAFAVVKAEQERLVSDWALANPDAEVVILRPTTAGAEDEASWVAQATRAATALGVDGEAAPVQFLHLDDLAAAVEHAVDNPLSGPYNVSADGWVDAETARALEGSPPRLQVSERIAGSFASFRWRYRLGQTPPGVLPYTMHPWIVSNGRLRSTGWVPQHTTEQTIVEAFPARPWAMLSPKQRQNLALGGVGAAVVGIGGAAVAATRRFKR